MVFSSSIILELGGTKATQLIKKFGTPQEVFKAIKNTKIIYTKTGNPKGIEGSLSEIKGFGWKFVQKNKAILFSGEEF